MDEITLGDKIYISSKRAAKITGYAKDYIGQLCREGRVDARLVGRNWYVFETSIREHRFGKQENSEERPKNVPVSPVQGWNAPVYRMEPETPLMPQVEAQKPSPEAPLPAAPVVATVSDMQAAWREWFETREAASAGTQEEHTGQLEETLPETPLIVTGYDHFPAESIPESSDISNNQAIFGGPITKDAYIQHVAEEVATKDYSAAQEYHPEDMYTAALRQPVDYDLQIPMRQQEDTASLARQSPEPSAARLPRVSKESRRSTSSVNREAAGAGSLALQATLLAIAGLAFIMALIGSGAADEALAKRSGNAEIMGSVVNFLQGEVVQ